MKRNLRRAVWAIAILMAGMCGMFTWRAHLEHVQIAEEEATRAWLDNAIVPSFTLKGASNEEAIAELSKHLESAAGKPKELHIEFASKEETLRSYHREIKSIFSSHVTVLGLIPSSENSEKSKEKLTLDLKEVPLSELLRHVSHYIEWGYEIRGRRILVHRIKASSEEFAPLITEEIHYSELPYMFSRNANATISGNPDWENVQPALELNSVSFYEG